METHILRDFDPKIIQGGQSQHKLFCPLIVSKKYSHKTALFLLIKMSLKIIKFTSSSTKQFSYLIRINFRADKFSRTLDSEKIRADLFSRSPIHGLKSRLKPLRMTQK